MVPGDVPYTDEADFYRTDLETRQLRGYVYAMGQSVFDLLVVKLQLTDEERHTFTTLTRPERADDDGDLIWPPTRSRLDTAVRDFIVDEITMDRVPRIDSGWDVRMVCPLCGDRPDQADGFAYPTGITRHLDGWGKMRQCSVMTSLVAMSEYARAAFDRTGQSGGWY